VEKYIMSLDPSLRGKSTLERHRNVLKRSERIAFLEDQEKWSQEKSSVFALLKVAHRKASAGKKPAKTEAAEGATVAATPAGTATPAATAAKAAPAKGAPVKAAAPAAKAKK
jgi:small basic protein (TIGR04137 family)